MWKSQSLGNDVSKISRSTIKIHKGDYMTLQEQLKQVKYPTSAISKAQSLRQKIAMFKSTKVQDKLANQLQSLNSYRKVRGDGNCFFRAVAFAFLSHLQSTKPQQCFRLIQQVSLTCCNQPSIPRQFSKFYDHNFLLYVLNRQWQMVFEKYLKQSNNIRNKALLKLFDENPYLDFILVLYFRSVCLKALHLYKQKISQFLTGEQQNAIRTYSQQTEGVSLNLMSIILQINISVFEARKDQVITYKYFVANPSDQTPSISLLFYENHYDIIQKNNNITAENSVIQKKQDYFGHVNERLKLGRCVQCSNNCYVYEVSGLCLRCHETSLNSLHDFGKEAFIKAQCNQCGRYKEVSNLYKICRSCIQDQNNFEEQRKIDAKKKKCGCCGNLSLEIIEEIGICKKCQQQQNKIYQQISSKKQVEYKFGHCKRCKTQDNIRIDNNLCGQCFALNSPTKKQTVTNNIQKPQSQKTNGSIPSGYTDKICRKCKYLKIDQNFKNGLCQSCFESR